MFHKSFAEAYGIFDSDFNFSVRIHFFINLGHLLYFLRDLEFNFLKGFVSNYTFFRDLYEKILLSGIFPKLL